MSLVSAGVLDVRQRRTDQGAGDRHCGRGVRQRDTPGGGHRSHRAARRGFRSGGTAVLTSSSFWSSRSFLPFNLTKRNDTDKGPCGAGHGTGTFATMSDRRLSRTRDGSHVRVITSRAGSSPTAEGGPPSMSPFPGSARRTDDWRHLRLTTRRRRRHRHPGPPREAQRAHLRRLRRPARPARRAVPRALRTRPRAGRRGARLLLRRRRRRDHRRHARHGHRPAARLQPDDRAGRTGAARVPLPGDRRGARRRRGRRCGPRARRRLPCRRPVRPLRLPLHPGRALRRRHGRGLSAAARRRPRPRHPAADARRAGPRPRGRADRPDQRADRRGPGRRPRRGARPPPRRRPRPRPTPRPRRCSPPNSTCRSPPPSRWTPPPRPC